MLINVMQILNNVESWNSFNPELQLKDTESAIINKLIDLFTELKGFKKKNSLGWMVDSQAFVISNTFISNARQKLARN